LTDRARERKRERERESARARKRGRGRVVGDREEVGAGRGREGWMDGGREGDRQAGM